MDHEEIVIVSRIRPVTEGELRRFTRRVCETVDTVGWDLLIDDLDQGIPSYPVVDELICMCVEKIRSLLGSDFIGGRLMIEFEPELPDIDKIIIQLERILQGKNNLFHLFLLGPDETNINALVVTLGNVYYQLDTAGIAIG